MVPAISSTANLETSTSGSGVSKRAILNFTKSIINTVTTTNTGYYTTSSISETSTQLINKIQESLDQGNRWFMTGYDQMPNPIEGPLSPWTGSIPGSGEAGLNQLANNLIAKGVAEITATRNIVGPPAHLVLGNLDPDNFTIGVNFGGTVSPPDFGMIIWQAQTEGFLLVSNATLSGVGAGALLPSNPSPTIVSNFDSITTDFGSNPKPS
jgi:hypothetical protein